MRTMEYGMWTSLIGRSRTTTLRWSVVPTSYEVIASKAPLSLSGYGLLTKTYSKLFYGADYDVTGFGDFHRSVWICPVTLFVLGRYPKYIYVK